MIAKKTRELFVSLMEAYAQNPDALVEYQPETEQYSGYFNPSLLDKFIEQGAFELIEHTDTHTSVIMNNHDDFLSSFAAGVNEAKLGRDQYYADYNANPFAFSVGFEHFLFMHKKPKRLEGYSCHGF
ncbi:hypothetical protein [Paraglaciecola aestuariivivens]